MVRKKCYEKKSTNMWKKINQKSPIIMIHCKQWLGENVLWLPQCDYNQGFHYQGDLESILQEENNEIWEYFVC